MLFVLSALGLTGLGAAGLLIYWSQPGKPRPFTDAKGRPLSGSIAEKVWVPINGVEQGMVLEGKDASKPVLLYLHGGMPEFFLTQRYPTGLEEEFVVCWWDQRGSGLSYRPGEAAPTLEQLIADTVAVTHYLRQRFGHDRIYLMGHSGGSFLGLQVVAREPQLFHAWLGVAQMTNQLASEQEAWAFARDAAQGRGDEALARALELAPVTATEVPTAWLQLRDRALHEAGGGTMRQMRSVVSGLFLESLRNRELTLGEKVKLWRGKASAGVSSMWKDMLATDLSVSVPKLAVPAYFFHGVHDRTCSYAEAVKSFERLEAPLKGFYAFEQSAHSPVFEEPAKFIDLIRRDVLAGRNALADRH